MPASAPRVSLGCSLGDKENKATLAAGHATRKVFPPIPWDGMDILSQTCVHGKGREGKETEEDKSAKNWHDVKGLSLPPKAQRLFILDGQVPMIDDSHKPQEAPSSPGVYLNPPSAGFGRAYGCSSSDTLFLSGSELSSWRRQMPVFPCIS